MGLDTTGHDPILAINGGVFVRETIPGRLASFSDLAALTTQVLHTTAILLYAGDLVTNIAYRSGATAAGTPTNWWFALYDDAATPALIAQTADQLTAAWGANTTQTLAISTPYRVPRTAIYYIGVMVKATTPPSLVGESLFNAGISTGLVSGQKTLAQTSGAALTGTAPATIATPTAGLNRHYAAVS